MKPVLGAPAGRIPLKARLPWFVVWVPAALLLYALVNGAGHVRIAYRVLNIFPLCLETGFVLRCATCPCSPWGFLLVPVLAVFALVCWKLCPQWSPGVRRLSCWLGVWLSLAFLLTQAALLCPRGWRVGMPIWSELRICFVQVWKPHFCRPVLEELDWSSPAWRAHASDFASLLTDQDAGVRLRAVHDLGNLQPQEYTPNIATLLTDSDASVRYHALRTLGSLGLKEYAPSIVPFLKDPEARMRTSSAEALGKLGAKEYASSIATLLQDPNEYPRGFAAEALGKLGAKEYVPDIAAVLKEPNLNMSIMAARALASLTGQKFPGNERAVRAALTWWEQHKNDSEFAPKR